MSTFTPRKNEFTHDVNIKSKYLNNNEQRQLVINPLISQISISQSGNPSSFKEFHLDQLQSHQARGNTITLQFDNGRKYQIQSSQPHNISQALKHAKNMHLSNKFVEQGISYKPVGVNYAQLGSSTFKPKLEQPSVYQARPIPSSVNQIGQAYIHQQSNAIRTVQPHLPLRSKALEQQRKKKNFQKYKKLNYYHRPQDWKINPQEGNLAVVNEEWKGNTTRIFGFVLKRFISTGTFMGISFPVFAMKTESILESYARSISPASNILSPTKDPVERMKQFSCLLWAMSLLQVTIVKPFNPVLGQTFQADINGGRYSSEQVCHHPPISAFYYQKDHYRIFGSLQMSASIGINSGDGRFIGDITIQYDDGYWCKGKLPNGKITGVLIGTTTFEPYGGSYIYDSNKCVLTYELGQNSQFQGYLGLLNYKTQKQLQQTLKKEERFLGFTPYKKEQYSRILSHFRAKYTQWVTFDGKEYINLNNPAVMPYQLVEPFDEMLKSDSRFRRDIELLKQGRIDEAQEEKERIENQQRAFRKLRQQYSAKS